MSRIAAGRELADTQIASPDAGQSGFMVYQRSRGGPAQPNPEVDALSCRVEQWRDYNQTWLDRNLGGEAAAEYKSASTHWTFGRSDPVTNLRYLREDVEAEISKLQSIHDRLAMWAPDDETPAATPIAYASPHAPIFIVHGSDNLRAERVARTVKEATGRQTIILREQASLGQTLIEKFEKHAAEASYAIVVLTPDDEGGRKDLDDPRPRGRQNVIFEMGYFYGILSRSRVSVLLHPGVEKPSDIDGIVYITFDDNGAWKTELFRELESSQIHIDMSRVV